VLELSAIAGLQQAQDKHAAWFRAKSGPGRRQKKTTRRRPEFREETPKEARSNLLLHCSI
jgi:hypothetical protein